MAQSLVKSKVDSFKVAHYARESGLNKKFQGTWVAEGLPDVMTKGILGRTAKQGDLIKEIVKADH